MKIAIGGVVNEINTFSSFETTVELFKQRTWERGETILSNHRGVRDYLGGMIDRAEALGIEVIPTFAAFAEPAGKITRETYETIKSELAAGIQAAGTVDAICLSLHGAGVVVGIDDMEGDLLQYVRSQVGYELPLIVTLDLHGNLTEKMVAEANVLLGVHLYPHTDCYERGIEAVDIAEQMVKGGLQTAMHLTKLPLMIPTSTTNLSPAKDINAICLEWEKHPDVIDCAFFHGFPYTDHPDVGVSVVAVTRGDQLLAKEVADDVANQIWAKREEFTPQFLSPAEGIRQALAAEGLPIVINETSDNPGGGSPGDGTYLLRAMLEANLQNACFAFIYDPEVAQIAHEAGVGATITVKLGGKVDKLHGEPIELTATVKSLTDGRFIISSSVAKGTHVDLGKSVRLQVGGLDILVCSVRTQVLDEQIYLLHGIDVNTFKIVALKSSQHFRAAFEPISKQIITVDSPGLSTLQFSFFDYKRLTRPIYPLDEISVHSF
ncbi:M81 family metallopeptidase [Paenibacillus sp. N3.4]|uniref:M81 family metallopeptidase n=1 Tax=Paenibacillus sp. N3.4 TaxID=2603222 RepID=UPI0011CA9873|nr:M81 family metallopeptidase [Paenibacillus sp. N3.4]TXK86173.1 M81 family metallopeptidase [Paenibacillus sp. N3.4]